MKLSEFCDGPNKVAGYAYLALAVVLCIVWLMYLAGSQIDKVWVNVASFLTLVVLVAESCEHAS